MMGRNIQFNVVLLVFWYISLLLLATPNLAQDYITTVNVTIDEYPDYSGTYSKLISTSENDIDGRDEFLIQNGSLDIKFKFSPAETILKVRYNLESLPEGYRFYKLTMEYPLTQISKRNTCVLSPFSTEVNFASETRILYATPVKESTPLVELYQIYQRSKFVSDYRLNRLNNDWEKLSDYDIQSCYVYLSSVIQLVNRDFLAIPEDVAEKVNWMRNAIHHKGDRVKRAVSIGNAQALVGLADNLESDKFTIYWNYSLNEFNLERRYMMLKDLLARYRNYPSQDMRAKIVRGSRITEYLMISGLANSLHDCLRKQNNRFQGFDSEVTWLIEQLELALPSINEEEKRIQTSKDIDAIRGLISMD